MGLIRTAFDTINGVISDQWKEYFICDALPGDVLVRKGVKKGKGKGDDNIISDGSVIVVHEGQCAMIVEQGQIVEFTAEPGAFTFNCASEPSIFTGNFGDSLLAVFQTLGKRFTFGGETGNDQRVYYFNTKEIVDNKFGTPNPVPFRAVDKRIGMDIDVLLRCSGVYSYHIVDPMTFYVKVCGNVQRDYTRSELDAQLKAEFISALQPAIGNLSNLELRPSQLTAHTKELEAAMKQELSEEWSKGRGLEVATVALSSVTLPDEYQEMITRAQKNAMYMDPAMAAAMLASSKGDAMVAAAKNTNGSAAGFMGMSMAAGSSDDLSALYAQGKAASASSGWTCPACGQTGNTGKFCGNCGTKKPEEAWVCPQCGTKNTGKFCAECGTAKA